MKKNKNLGKIFLHSTSLVIMSFLLLAVLWGCKDDKNSLSVSVSEISFEAEGGTKSLMITTDAGSWNITNPASDWLSLSATSGTTSPIVIAALVSTKTVEERSATLTITAGNADPVQVKVSQALSEYIYTLEANVSKITFRGSGSSSTINITSTASDWTLSCDSSWISFDKTTGDGTSTSIIATATANTNTNTRTATIHFSAEYTEPLDITVSQYPSFNTTPIEPDNTGMTDDASELAGKMIVGWNLGNTLEAIGGETAWGNPKTSQALIDLVKNSGFNAVRIPCAWNGYADLKTAKISEAWLTRVKEVIGYCINNNMYVILNIHWDSGWLEKNCTTKMQEANNAKQQAFWEQIATYMRDYDEHLLFASANEPDVSDATGMTVLKSYHQTFIDAVRSTGGKNAYRTLVVQGPSTDFEKTNKLMNSLPNDNLANRMMVEVHYYTPYQFCLMDKDADWGKMFYYWGANYHSKTDTEHNATWGEEADLQNLFGLMKTKFTSKGIPVIIGEYAAVRRTTLTGDALTLHLASRAYFNKYLVQQAKADGMVTFYWDAGGMGNLGSAIFNRQNNTVFDQQVLDSIMVGAQ